VTGGSTTINSNVSGTANASSLASCPSGSTVVGGGYTWAGATPNNVTVITDEASSTTGWAVTIQNNSTTTATSGAFAATALCAS
jgi:hypothetical protein